MATTTETETRLADARAMAAQAAEVLRAAEADAEEARSGEAKREFQRLDRAAREADVGFYTATNEPLVKLVVAEVERWRAWQGVLAAVARSAKIADAAEAAGQLVGQPPQYRARRADGMRARWMAGKAAAVAMQLAGIPFEWEELITPNLRFVADDEKQAAAEIAAAALKSSA